MIPFKQTSNCNDVLVGWLRIVQCSYPLMMTLEQATHLASPPLPLAAPEAWRGGGRGGALYRAWEPVSPFPPRHINIFTWRIL